MTISKKDDSAEGLNETKFYWRYYWAFLTYVLHVEWRVVVEEYDEFVMPHYLYHWFS